MNYTIMHKNIQVLDIKIDDLIGIIKKVGKLYNTDHLPLGTYVKKGIVDRTTLNEWWESRSLPENRYGVKNALKKLDISNTKVLLLKSNGLSLSDQYWIKPVGSNIEWKDINLFENAFTDDVGQILLGYDIDNKEIEYTSPDNSTDGFLKKRWMIEKGVSKLIKTGTPPYMQQPFNEAIASCIMDRLKIPHVKYSVIWDDNKPYSVCDDFITIDTELVTAWTVFKTKKQNNNTSIYRHLINCCNDLGIKGVVHSLDQMIVLDYIIANEDRHMNNFGFVRNANTLEWIGFAPIYDSGSSLGYNKLSSQILSGRGVECKPFKKNHEEQIKLVSSFDWIDFTSFDGLDEEIREILENAKEYYDQTRTTDIIYTIKKRIQNLEHLAIEKQTIVDNISDDVLDNIAENYSVNFDM